MTDVGEEISGAATPLPRFDLPDAVGLPMSREESAALVQRLLNEISLGLDCVRAAMLSVVTSEAQFVGVGTVGYLDETFRGLSLPLSEFAPLEQALKARSALVLPDSPLLPGRLSDHMAGRILVAPIFLGERPLALVVGQLRPDAVVETPLWQARIQEVLARAALAVEVRRASAAYQEEVHRRQYTREIAAAILEGKPLPDVASLIIEIVARRLRVERVGLYLRGATAGIAPIALRGISTEFGAEIARLAQRQPLKDRAEATGLPLYVRDVQAESQLPMEMRELFRREKVGAMLMAMLQHSEAVRGALVVYSDGQRTFTPLDLSAFQGFADMATLGIALSQQMEQRREIAMMEERNRLAREIHDTVAQSLAALVLQMETARNYVSAGNSGAGAELLNAATAQARQALQETRRAVQGLAPLALETMSPAQAIARELETLDPSGEIGTQFILTGDEIELTPDQQTALLRIAQEALGNARRHARAHRIRVGLHYGADDVMLLVEDDGIGFDVAQPHAPGPDGGYGLFGMEERARLLEGRLEIDSTPGWGTRIRTLLPYRPTAEKREEGRDRASSVSVFRSTATEDLPGGTAAPRSPEPVSLRLPASPDLPIRVLIADDHALARQGIRAMLDSSGEIEVLGEAEDGVQAEARALALRPDVMLMDLQMPRADGIQALRRILIHLPDLPIIILTTFQSDEVVSEALQAGARGFLLKDAHAADLVAAVRAAYRGESVLTPAVTQRLAAIASGQHSGRTDSGTDLRADLNERELEVLQLLARGARNKEIGAALFIAPKTVEYHLSNIFSKLNVSNRTEAARAALERGLIAPGSYPLK
jgi:DNA-binding NarL/FixJ family response regulator/signal transduction histidine kinase